MRSFSLCIVTLCLLVLGCDSGGNPMDDVETGSLFLSISNLDPLPGNYHLEGWVVTQEAQTQSTGKFTVNASGILTDLEGVEIMARRFDTDFSLDNVTAMYITIEPSGDTNDEPSETRLMGGLFIDNQASLKATDVEGIEDELVLAAGNYIVETPTNGLNTDEESGIWFINLTGGPQARGLRTVIPIRGWQYQAWAEFDGIPLNMGIITHHSRPDDSSIYSGPLPGHNFPGEDFLTNAPSGLSFPLSVANARLLISLEPDPDPDPARSQFVLFEARVPETIAMGETYNLANLVDRFPKGTSTIAN